MITVDCSQTGLTLLDANGSKMQDTVYWPRQHGERTGALRDELGYFAECIRQNQPPNVITAEEAVRAVIVMEAAERSAETGSPVEPGEAADV